MKTKHIIGLAGPMGVGKTTTARWIAKLFGPDRTEIFSIAGPIKDMLRPYLAPYAEEPENKNNPLYGLCGKSPRHCWQTLGTEWGRDLIGQNIWTEIACNRIKSSQAELVIVDDLRFDNEALALRGLGAVIIHLEREGVQRSAEHISEGGINENYIDFKCQDIQEQDVKSILKTIGLYD